MSYRPPNLPPGQYPNRPQFQPGHPHNHPPHGYPKPKPKPKPKSNIVILVILASVVGLLLVAGLVIGNMQGLKDLAGRDSRSDAGLNGPSVYQQWLEISLENQCYDNCPVIDGDADRAYADRRAAIFTKYEMYTIYNYPTGLKPNFGVITCFEVNPYESGQTASGRIRATKIESAKEYTIIGSHNPYNVRELPQELADKVSSEDIDARVSTYCPEFLNDNPVLGGWKYLSDIGR